MGKNRSINQLDHMDSIINYWKKRRVGGFGRAYMGKHI